MHESPSTAQLLDAVITFLAQVATPALTGHAQFHARVSANALALVARELAQRETGDAQAITLYNSLLGDLAAPQASLASLEAILCEAIRSGEMDQDTPSLLASLRTIATAQLEIDQPSYSGLKI
jgi:Domain of unknown function (DUF6285)